MNKDFPNKTDKAGMEAAESRIRHTGSGADLLKTAFSYPEIIFGLKFIVFLAIGFYILDADFFKEAILKPYSNFTALISSKFLSHLGIANSLKGSILSYQGKSVNVEIECSAAQVMAVYFSAVAAYPDKSGSRLKGLLIGFFAIYLVNIIRISALFLIVVFSVGSFHIFHVFIGQAFVITGAFLVWTLFIQGKLRLQGFTSPESKEIFWRAGVFFTTLLFGLVLYNFFIKSALAEFLASSMVSNSVFFLSYCGIDAVQSGQNIGNSGLNLKVINTCLAPPIFILYYAFLYSSKFGFKVKIALTFASIPLFYAMGTVKVVQFFLQNRASDIRESFFYNHYYPSIIIVLAIIAVTVALLGNKHKLALKYLLKISITAVVSYSLWVAISPYYQNIFILLPLERLFGIEKIGFDPYQVFSSMPGYQVPLTVSLFLFLPTRSLMSNLRLIALALLFFLIWQLAVIGFFNSFPIPFRAGYLRLFAILPPILYWAFHLWKIKTAEESDASAFEPG